MVGGGCLSALDLTAALALHLQGLQIDAHDGDFEATRQNGFLQTRDQRVLDVVGIDLIVVVGLDGHRPFDAERALSGGEIEHGRPGPRAPFDHDSGRRVLFPGVQFLTQRVHVKSRFLMQFSVHGAIIAQARQKVI